jgi:hypothetical protein
MGTTGALLRLQVRRHIVDWDVDAAHFALRSKLDEEGIGREAAIEQAHLDVCRHNAVVVHRFIFAQKKKRGDPTKKSC